MFDVLLSAEIKYASPNCLSITKAHKKKVSTGQNNNTGVYDTFYNNYH